MFVEKLTTFLSLEPIEIFIKLILIYILSGIIGLERAALSKPAGFRTHVLVGMSAVLTVACGQELSYLAGTGDASRIPAQLLSGIGFLGAGTILRDGFNVKGLTTAASLLAVTCIGLCIGAGLYLTGIISTGIVYIVLKHSHAISDKVEHYNDFNLEVESSSPKEVIKELQELMDKNKVEIQEMVIEKDEENTMKYIKISGRHRDEINKNMLMSDIMEIDKINKVLEI